MRPAIALIVIIGLAAALWWKRDDAVRLAGEHVPAAKPYLLQVASFGGAAAPAPAASGRPPPPAVPVVVAVAAERSLPVTLEAVGTVQAVATVPIKPRIDSQIETVKVSEGARVKEGDLLFTLDSRAIKAQLAQADAQIERDRAQIEQGRRDLTRAEELLAKRISTEVQRDTAATAVKVLAAQLAADEAQRANLAALVSYTDIRSPVSGRIGSIQMKAGTTVRAADAQAIATVNQIDPIYVSFAVPQSLFSKLREALRGGDLTVEARTPGGVSAGKIAFVENAVDLATGTVLAKALVPNAEETLWPGTFVSVVVRLGTDAKAVAIPSSAVQIGQQGPYLFVIRDGKAELRSVKVDRTVGSDSVIASGISPGDRVVIDGQLRLVNGAAVQVGQERAGEVAKRGDTRGGTSGDTGAAPDVPRRG